MISYFRFSTSTGSSNPLALDAPFSPTQFGPDLKLWVDLADASSVNGPNAAPTGFTSKGATVLSLLPTEGTQLSYDPVQRGVLLKAGQLNSSLAISLTDSLVFVVVKDAGVSSSAGFASLANNFSGMQVSRQPYGAGGGELQMNAVGSSQSAFIPFASGGFNSVAIGQDSTSLGLRVNGSQPYGSIIPVGSQLHSALLTLSSSSASSGLAQLFHEVLVLPMSYLFLSQLLEGYTHWKWNQVALLPADHPFKIKAPVVGDYYDLLSLPDAEPGDTPSYISPS
jgi:hypothetical protein